MKAWVWFIVLTCLVLILSWGVVRLLARPDLESNRGAALQKLLNMVPDGLHDLGNLVVANYREYRANSVRWSAAYFGCIFGSAFLSALAGVILKIESLAARPALRNDLAASFAATAALLITLATVGEFQRKWEANRIAASAMENLAYELLKSGKAVDRDTVLGKIQDINESRNAGVVGEAKRVSGVAAEKRIPEAPRSIQSKVPQGGSENHE
jgi:hypothetical protein